ncbi:MAG: cysteine hydrolase [Acetobacteraceae bacterium]|nr:cysteine hydrolase [Acetobacteraceae bacterium]
MTEVEIAAAESALVIVDMQNDFCMPGGYYARQGRDISGLHAAITPTAALLARARGSGMHVAFTRLVYDPARGAMEERHRIRPLRWSASGGRLLPGTWGSAVVDALAPLPTEIVIDKHGYSAFDETGLEQQLKARGVRTLVFAGVVTYACVLASAFAAFDRGFDVLIARESVGTWVDRLGEATHDIVEFLLGRSLVSERIAITPDGRAT